jgi:hypothetical protein
MVEWYARARRGDDVDTWYIGTKMKQWASRHALPDRTDNLS